MDDTRSDLTHGQNRPQQEESKHPDEWRRDLEPNRMAGQNLGPRSVEREVPIPTAFDLKALHQILPELTDDELRQIPILSAGTRLEQGATYLLLGNDAREQIRAMGSMEVPADRYVVPKDRVPYPLWNRLLGVDRPG